MTASFEFDPLKSSVSYLIHVYKFLSVFESSRSSV